MVWICEELEKGLSELDDQIESRSGYREVLEVGFRHNVTNVPAYYKSEEANVPDEWYKYERDDMI